MEDDDNLDVHLCLSCQLKMTGLDNYIQHKKVECPSLKQRLSLSGMNGCVTKSPSDSRCGTLICEQPVSTSAESGFELETSCSMAISFSPLTPMTATASSSDLLIDLSKSKHSRDQDNGKSGSLDDISDDACAVDCFFESLQLRSRFGPVQANSCKSDYYSRLFDPQPLHLSEDADVYIPPKLTPTDGVLLAGQSRSSDTSLDVCSSLTSVQFYSTVPEEFSSSDTEDLISFSCDDVNSDNQPCLESNKLQDFSKAKSADEQQVLVQAPVTRRGTPRRLTSLPGKWRPGERPVLTRHGHPERDDLSPTTKECDEEQDDDDYENNSSSISSSSSSSELRCADERTDNSYEGPESDAEKLMAGEKRVPQNQHRDPDCDRSGKSAVSPTAPYENVAGSPLGHRCSVCGVDYRTKYSYVRHLKTPLHKRRAKGFCRPEVSESSGDLPPNPIDVRMRSLISKQKPAQCRVCQFYADSKNELVEHVLSDEHAGAVQRISVECARCQFVANTSTEMLTHLRSSEHDVVSSSSGCCILRKQTRSTKRSPAASVRFVLCDQCPATFRSESSLTVHRRRRHTHERPFSCQICCKSFADNSTLTLHKKTARHRQKQLAKK